MTVQKKRAISGPPYYVIQTGAGPAPAELASRCQVLRVGELVLDRFVHVLHTDARNAYGAIAGIAVATVAGLEHRALNGSSGVDDRALGSGDGVPTQRSGTGKCTVISKHHTNLAARQIGSDHRAEVRTAHIDHVVRGPGAVMTGTAGRGLGRDHVPIQRVGALGRRSTGVPVIARDADGVEGGGIDGGGGRPAD